eukprot:Blabericola_migrator_1__656@NODE_1163_length_5233_cov_27_435927_g793_i0_p6_GENE_NODE_1163_length_5233_cov_27_435927_g793_i0NODE_1163_length_5233_cov_27_435927_g793_i0_p6_ORF_typecomplete_len122_score13_20_NODE_1163_length_5233_cov_27_435927_g793_i048665231
MTSTYVAQCGSDRAQSCHSDLVRPRRQNSMFKTYDTAVGPTVLISLAFALTGLIRPKCFSLLWPPRDSWWTLKELQQSAAQVAAGPQYALRRLPFWGWEEMLITPTGLWKRAFQLKIKKRF